MSMRVEPTDATLGAVITGVALKDLDHASWREIEAAFHEYGVLILPGQGLSSKQQVDFAAHFGEIELLVGDSPITPISNQKHDGSLLPDDSHNMRVMRGNEGWHTDSSYMPLSAKASILSARVVPSKGGQTEWADMRAAYDALGTNRRTEIAELSAYHSLFQSQAKVGHDVKVGSGYGFFDGEPPLRPLTKVHPETGRTALYIGRHAYQIQGLGDQESQKLLDELLEFSCQPPRTYMHDWQPGDIVVWDNRCLLHRARPFDYAEPRVMMHTRIKGDPATEAAESVRP